MTALRIGLGAVALGMVASGAACAQGAALDRRVMAVADGRVEFNVPARTDACGDGMHWYRVGTDAWYGRSMEAYGAPGAPGGCTAGPLRVRATVVGRELVRLENFVGPLQRDSAATDLGAVDAREAAAWLLTVARQSAGRPARDAIAAVTLVQGGTAGDGLAALARDDERARDTRRSAVSGLLRLEGGAGIGALVTLAERADDPWLAGEAVRALGRSGDPRARRALRAVLADRSHAESLRGAAASGLGGEYATGDDAKQLRDAYASFETEDGREAVLGAVASVGGKANAAWLLALAQDARQPVEARRRAVSLAERAGVTGRELSALFDAAPDTETRVAVLTALAREGSRASRDKLVAVARSTEAPQLRRRAVAALERFDSPEVREVLTTLAAPRPQR